MIRSIQKGDLFSANVQTYVVTVNLLGAMGKGVALTAKTLYPAVERNYRIQCRNGNLVIGKMMSFAINQEQQLLLIPTKVHFKDPSKMEWVEAALIKFCDTYKEKGITSVAFPPLGAGNGWLKFDKVIDLMRKYLDPIDIPVDIYYLE